MYYSFGEVIYSVHKLTKIGIHWINIYIYLVPSTYLSDHLYEGITHAFINMMCKRSEKKTFRPKCA